MHVDGIGVEAHHVRHRNPAHLNIVRVFTGEIKHPSLFDIAIANGLAEADMSGEQKSNRGFPISRARGKRIDKPPPQNAVPQIVGRHEPCDEILARYD